MINISALIVGLISFILAFALGLGIFWALVIALLAGAVVVIA